jgi:hypothetical protein
LQLLFVQLEIQGFSYDVAEMRSTNPNSRIRKTDDYKTTAERCQKEAQRFRRISITKVTKWRLAARMEFQGAISP